MFRKMLTAAAAIALAATTAAHANPLGQAPTPAPAQEPAAAPATYVGEIDGVPVVLQLAPGQGRFGGTLMVGTGKYPVEGRTEAGVLRGSWRDAGTENAMTLTPAGDKLRLETNGKTVVLAPAAGSGGGNLPPAVPVAAAEPFGRVSAEARAGWSVPVPAGWTARVEPLFFVVSSPDGRQCYASMPVLVEPGATAEQATRKAVDEMGLPDPKFVRMDRAPGAVAADAPRDVAIYTFAGGDGVAKTVAVHATVEGKVAHCLVVATPSARFDEDAPHLVKLLLGARKVEPQAAR